MSLSYPSDKNKPLPRVSIDEITTEQIDAKEYKSGWRPWTFSTTILISAVFFSAGLVVLIGLLQWQQSRNGALFAISTTDDFSAVQNFLYQYLPTLIIVLYGMGWSWIDLDVKRLEPWFQLSQKDGATADRSLLLHYPLDFLPFVPFRAAKRRQWSVFSASMIMVLVVWAVTPLQNGIFSNTLLNRSTKINLHHSEELVPLAQQIQILGINILNDLYSTTWLGQNFPPFTTKEYALAPFELADGLSLTGSNQTISAATTMYSAELICNPPTNSSTNVFGVTIDDGKGCNAQDVIPMVDAVGDARFMSYFIGYFDNALSESSLQLAGCGLDTQHTFLAIWKRASKSAPNFNDPSNATALFCKPSYYQQRVNATMSMPDKTVLSIVADGSQVPLNEAVFNISQFEYILANGAPPDVTGSLALDEETLRRDIVDLLALHQDTRVANMSLIVPVPNMIGFAIGATRLQGEAYSDASVFSAALQDAYKAAFASSISAVMAVPNTGRLTEGDAHAIFQTVSLVPVFSVLSQVFLLMILAITCLLLFLTQNRPSRLTRDPDSLAQIMSLAGSDRLRHLFNQWDSCSDKQLEMSLRPYKFWLEHDTAGYQSEIHYSTLERPAYSSTDGPEQKALVIHSSWDTAKLGRPLEYTFTTRLLMIVCVTGLICSLVVLRREIARQDGLQLPSENTIVQQIVINYIPTSVATLLEPFLTLLCRLACLMQPLEKLHFGNATARQSLLARYTSVPPQLVAWRALRDGKIVLASLCLLTILANVLTVALSGLLNINDTIHMRNTSLRQLYQPKFDAIFGTSSPTISSYNIDDAFIVADTNITGHTDLPAWVEPHYYFIPLDIGVNSLSEANDYEYRASVQAYGSDLKCEELSLAPSNATYEMDFGQDLKYVRIHVNYTQADGTKLQCKPGTSVNNATGGGFTLIDQEFSQIGGNSQGRKAFEVSIAMVSMDAGSISPADPCNAFVVRGWVRVANGTSAGQQMTDSSNITTGFTQPDGVVSTFISCKPRVKSRLFDTTLSSTGSVLSAIPQGPDEYLRSRTGLEFAINTTTSNFNGQVIPIWHDDTIAGDWTNYLIKTLSGSTSFLDATLPPPSFAAAANMTSEVFSRLFAIQLSLISTQLNPSSEEAAAVPAQLLVPQRRIFMSESLFWVALVVLSLDLVILIIFYGQLPRPFLPRLPTTIASQIAYFAGSHVVDDVQKAGGDLRELDKQGYRYGYGRYIGRDGWAHVGIERAPYVQNLPADQNSVKQRRWFG